MKTNDLNTKALDKAKQEIAEVYKDEIEGGYISTHVAREFLGRRTRYWLNIWKKYKTF